MGVTLVGIRDQGSGIRDQESEESAFGARCSAVGRGLKPSPYTERDSRPRLPTAD
jgi:hypothetical protein